VTNLARVGNTSAASIPIALDEAAATARPPATCSCSPFGAGLRIGARPW
jgi:3-oxoacyl-[acyl-carrier-protein] synthase III